MKNDQEHIQKSAGRYISELSRAAHVYFKYEFKQYGIGHAQIITLLFISRNEGLSQLELGTLLNLDKSSVTSQLSLLESNGFILRKKSETDGRILQLFITQKTKTLLEPLKHVFSNWTETLLKGFSEVERNILFDYFERMRSNAKDKLTQLKQDD